MNDQEDALPPLNAAYNATQHFLLGWEKDPRALSSLFERHYAQTVAEKFVVGGDCYSIGDIINSSGVAIGENASVDIDAAGAQLA